MTWLKYFLFSLCLLDFSSTSHAADIFSDNNEPDEYVQVRVIADKTNVKGQETIRLGIEQTIYPQWHTYWINPGDSGTPAEIEWNLPEGFTVTDLEWPTPAKIPYGPLTNYGYSGQVTLLQTLTIPDSVGSEPFAINGTVNLLVCHDICIPETHDVFISFNAEGMAEPEKISAAEKKLPKDVDWRAHYKTEENQFIIQLENNPAINLSGAKEIYLAPEDWGAIDNNADATLEKTSQGIAIKQKLGARDLNEIQNLPLVLAYKDLSGQNHAVRFVAQPSQSMLAPETSPKGNFFSAILFAILGGIILNLMPCVFPILSIKALSLINLGKKENKKAKEYGLCYALGILISFALIGGTLLVLKSGGSQIGWGFQLQNPVVITALAYLVFIIGLNLSSLFELNPKFGKLGYLAHKLSNQEGHRGAFFTGVLATLVATPCTAPFMGAALGFALTQPVIISMLVFLALGLGLAIPYLALCFFPTLRSKLPKPGPWMLTFKQFLSFPMFLTAVWLVWVLSQQAGSLGVLMALSGMVFISFTIWLYKVIPEKGIGHILGLGLMILSLIYVVSTFVTTNTMADMHDEDGYSAQNWSEFSPERLSEYLEGDSAVFTNMTAAWCITCKVNEKIALSNETITALFANKEIKYLKGDWTNRDSRITTYLESFDRQGVPLYVYYGPRDKETGARPDPFVLPQILTAGLVEKAILQN